MSPRLRSLVPREACAVLLLSLLVTLALAVPSADAAPRLSSVQLAHSVPGTIYGGGLSPSPGWCEPRTPDGRVPLRYTASAGGRVVGWVTTSQSFSLGGALPLQIVSLPMRQGANEVDLLRAPGLSLRVGGIDRVTVAFTLYLVPVDGRGGFGPIVVKRIRVACGT